MQPSNVISFLLGAIVSLLIVLAFQDREDTRAAEKECLAKAISAGVERKDITVEDGKCYL